MHCSGHQLSLLTTTWASSPALPWLAHPMQVALRSRTSSALRSSDLTHSHSYQPGIAPQFWAGEARGPALLIAVGGLKGGAGQLSYPHALRPGSPTTYIHSRVNSSVLPRWVQGLFSCVLELVMGRASLSF